MKTETDNENEVFDHEEQDAQLTLRVPASIKSELERLARSNHRTLSGEIRLALESHIAQQDGQ